MLDGGQLPASVPTDWMAHYLELEGKAIQIQKERDQARANLAQSEDDLRYMLDLMPGSQLLHYGDAVRVGCIRNRVTARRETPAATEGGQT